MASEITPTVDMDSLPFNVTRKENYLSITAKSEPSTEVRLILFDDEFFVRMERAKKKLEYEQNKESPSFLSKLKKVPGRLIRFLMS